MNICKNLFLVVIISWSGTLFAQHQNNITDTSAPMFLFSEGVRGEFMVQIIDTGAHPNGFDSIYVKLAENMQAAIPAYTMCSPETVTVKTKLIDTLRGGAISIHARTCYGNDQKIVLIPRIDPLDTMPPLFKITTPDSLHFFVAVSDNRPHDSGLLNAISSPLQITNFATTITAPNVCDTSTITYEFIVKDIFSYATFVGNFSDCAGNTKICEVTYFPKAAAVENPLVPEHSDFTIFPNPFSATSTITYHSQSDQHSIPNLRIVSLYGADITSAALVSITRDDENILAQISGARLPSGIYLAEFTGCDERSARCFAVAH